MPAPLVPAASRPSRRPTVARTALAAMAAVLALALLAPLGDGRGAATAPTPAPDLALRAAAPTPVTPGHFRGYGFDQCLTPTQSKMDAWLEHSPFLAVGVYISGNSRACRSQPNLTPTWVSTQLAKGWKILPITLGPQSSCVGRYPKYGASIDPTISNDPANGYARARQQAWTEVETAVAAAKRLGIPPGSTLWYDLEGWSNVANATCRESALKFLTAWTKQVRNKGYVSGVYSSAGSGMKILDDARAARRTDVTLPDQIWIARWDGMANTSTSYLRPDGWLPGRRMKQYQGGHDETWGGVTINIDRNYLDLGAATTVPAENHCNGTRVDLASYVRLVHATGGGSPNPPQVAALQCLLKEAGYYGGYITGNFNKRTLAAVQAWRVRHGKNGGVVWTRSDWITLLTHGSKPILKIGSRGPEVRRLQRALVASDPARRLRITGYFDPTTANAVTAYKKRVGISSRIWVVNRTTWAQLAAGRG